MFIQTLINFYPSCWQQSIAASSNFRDSVFQNIALHAIKYMCVCVFGTIFLFPISTALAPVSFNINGCETLRERKRAWQLTTTNLLSASLHT
jgi:hypothetical protein